MMTTTEHALVLLQVCTDQVAAEILANYLRVEAVPASVRSSDPVPGLEQGAEILVPASLLHRARWLLAQQPPSDADLDYLATGKLPKEDNAS